MEQIRSQIETYSEEIREFRPGNGAQLEQFRIRFLGSRGILKELFGHLREVPLSDRKELGQILNAFKELAEATYETALAGLDTRNKVQAPEEDLSLPGEPLPLGSRHPLSIIGNQIIQIFEGIGFTVAEGPEIEDDWHNFTALNMPADHPARDMQDTFYISRDPDWVLRTHTSSVQARVLDQGKLPVRIICPGRVYRNETVSARAHCFFHQVEGLYVDRQVSFADLKQTLYYFVHEMFGPDTRIRFRPSYFPFTEPSAEMDISCTVCGGEGCSLCKHTGWVEILGCGMVDPRMLENFRIDPEAYSGFAFGMGMERICQLKYRINDIRLYSQNDSRFLRQFRVMG